MSVLAYCLRTALVLLPAVTLAAPPLSAGVQTEQAAYRYLADYASSHQLADARITVQALPPQRSLPACSAPYAITAADTRFWQRLRFSLRCPGQTSAGEIIVRAELSAAVLVAQQDIPAGQNIDPASVKAETRSLSATPDALGNLAALAGQRTRRPIRTGQVLQQRFLQPQLLVQRGQAVQIVARQGGIEVSVPGEALQSGGRNEVIRVRNSTSKRIISAVVLDAGTVAPADAANAAP
ncbi:flagellar basal body P-ring formation chaperone FlgA [Vogesella oryzae]|uniref:flagellar basal body P-ring formation chaperone FlgA n=1 Tax=Vogesella oryzae TaxID=1735285 RepID=UPI0015834A47|nr:flagellar basal body P-ring formation chaperone FlgA [Vogesella oryzae]